LRTLVEAEGSGSMPTGVGTPRSGQIVVGNLPHSPPGLLTRVDLLDELAGLRGTSDAAMIAAVNGARGVGKTQLAAQYARRAVAHGWPVVVWLDAETEDSVVAGLARLATAAGLTPQTSTIDSARDAPVWLATHAGQGLVVYDNVEDPNLLSQWTPPVGTTQVVVTTVRGAVADLGHPVNVDVFTPDEPVQYLHERTGLDDTTGARRLAAELGRLPLALAQAAALIGPGQTRRGRIYRTFSAYLHAFAAASNLDHTLRAVPGADYPRSLAQTIHLSLHEVNAADPSGTATRLLHLLAVLAPTGVPTTLLADPNRQTWRRQLGRTWTRRSR
jgi:hypothetical protein